MTVAQRLGAISADLEAKTRAGEFVGVARCLMMAKGVRHEALQIAETRFTARVADVFRKTAVSPASLTSASSLAEFTGATAAFLESLRSVGAFDRMYGDMRAVPPRSRVSATTLNATAYVHGEASPKPISSLQLNGHQLAETEVAAILVLSDELVRGLSPEAGALIRRELAGAVAAATDTEFISLITAGLTPLTSAGATSNQIMQDIARLLNALDVDQSSKVYILAQPNTVKTIATKVSGTTGKFAFDTMGIQGGTLAGAEVIASDGVPSGSMIAVDAHAVAASTSALGIEILKQGDIELSDTPDSPATAGTTKVSLWQNDLVALLLRRHFGVELLRSTGAAMLNGVNYYTANSPA